MRRGETRVPIPNTRVKTWTADGTALVTMWESRWPPNKKRIASRKKARGSTGAKGIQIDTGRDRQPPVSANPVSRAVLLEIAGFSSDQRVEKEESVGVFRKVSKF